MVVSIWKAGKHKLVTRALMSELAELEVPLDDKVELLRWLIPSTQPKKEQE